ncbi:MAG: LysE family translocator [Alphaproteobacteria bacterium]|nr:LysE family translocator [Alphaproteobacteria bacterium]
MTYADFSIFDVSLAHIGAMCLFAFTMSISPGPVNLIILSSGATNGIRMTLPFVSGATFGFIALLFLVGIGIAQIVTNTPILMDVLTLFGVLFLGYVAYGIAFSKGDLKSESLQPPNGMKGVLLQWLNPKAWAACIAGVSSFTLDHSLAVLLLFCGLYGLICFLSLGLWAVLGRTAGQLLDQGKRLVIFNRMLAGLLVVLIVFLLSEVNVETYL